MPSRHGDGKTQVLMEPSYRTVHLSAKHGSVGAPELIGEPLKQEGHREEVCERGPSNATMSSFTGDLGRQSCSSLLGCLASGESRCGRERQTE